VREAEGRLAGLPAARAALDMALHDLLSRQLGVPLVEMLGRAHPELPTSITIGIRDMAASLAEADEYLARGFRVLKVKIGRSLEEDLERLGRIRERVGRSVRIRADANEGYTVEETRRFLDASETLDLELLEQPVPRREFAGLVALPERVRARIAADESLHDERDALDLAAARACGIFNIKLMKCGGIRPALRMAAIAETAGISLMWGCMDESVLSISAALHAAFASPATRYLDLDGSLDLSRDLAEGGFTIEQGQMRTLDLPGLGIRPV
jgi:L-alanine-DL-glutamate epimerase-like enolase superfamily enzyme